MFRAARRTDKERIAVSGDSAFNFWYFSENKDTLEHGGPPITYSGPEDVLPWIKWAKPQPHYFLGVQVERLAVKSAALNAVIFSEVMEQYRQGPVDRNNAIDFLFQTPPMPEWLRPKRVLDFGAGYGRQANLWSQHEAELCMVGMDAHESPYLLQNWYYSRLGLPLKEYIEDPEGFSVTEAPGLYHLPSWRHDMLPDDFFDMVLCVHVLQEIAAETLLIMMNCFRRVLRPGGALFIRDHGNCWQPVHTVDVDQKLQELGFLLEFRPYVRDSYEALYRGRDYEPDIHGIPRIFRKP